MKKFFDLQRFKDIDNSKPNKILNGTNGNDNIVNSGGIVTIKAGEGKNYISNSGSIVKIFSGSGNDTVSNNGSDVIISVSGGNDSISNSGENVTISAGNGNNSITSSGANAIISSNNGNDYIKSSYGYYVKIDSGKGDDYIYTNGNRYVSVSGNSGNDTIYNYEANYNFLSGGDGDDSINNHGVDVTISGGKGDDTITLSNYYSVTNLVKYTEGDGDDIITGFGSNDTLQISTSKFTSMKGGNDIYFIFDNGSITLQNIGEGVGSSNFVIIGNELPTGLSYNDDRTEITASKKFKGSSINLTKYPDVKTLNASAVTKKLKITGNSLDNSIQGGTKNDTILGGAGNDTLIGDAGNDILTGGKGEDIFVHTKGKDVITDYTAGEDMIKLQGATIKSWKVSGKNVIFTTTNGQITVKNGKGKEISILETKTYNSSSSALFAENNFATADNLSEIVKNDLTATDYKIETQNFDSLTQKNNLITFAEK